MASDEFMATVNALAPVITAHAAVAHDERRLPDELIEALDAAGLFALQAPRDVGGREVDSRTALEVFAALAAVDASVAWCVAIGSTGAAVLGGRMSAAGAHRVFKHGVPRVAGTFAPSGTATRVTGGYIVNGRWSFASGIVHAAWLTAGCVDDSGNLLTAVIPPAAATVIDNWHVLGLESTASCDWEVHDHFVADECIVRPDSVALRGGSAFRLPLFSFIAPAHVGVALGCARRALDELVAASDSVRAFGGGELAARQRYQHAVAEAHFALRSATLLAHDVLANSPENDVAVRAASAYITQLAVDVCTTAFRFLGGRAVFDAHPAQRCVRDVFVAAQHVYVAESAITALGTDLLAGRR